MSGTFAAIFSLEESKKWIIRDGRNGISMIGSGAPTARGWKKSRGFRMAAKDILLSTKPIRESTRWPQPPSFWTGPTNSARSPRWCAVSSTTRSSRNAEHYDHEDEFPEPIVEQMKELGLFGVTIPEEYGGMGLDLTTYAMIVEELSRGWISISGVVNTHFIGSYLLMKFGTDEQKEHFLPKMATGELRAAFSLSEPEVGSDVQGIKATATKDGDDWVLNGQKMWVTNGLLSGVVFVLMKNDTKADPPYKGMTCFITEKEPGVAENTGDYAGLTVPPKIKKMGYKGVESTELVYDGYRCSPDRILGGEEAGLGQGFRQMMDALEVGRVNVAARGVGIAQRALELALRYSQERKTFGKPIAQHQAIQFKLADMATKVEAARLLTLQGRPHEGRRAALRRRGRHGQAVRLRGRQGGRRGLVPHPRRLRLLEGVRDRAPLPRRAAAADRRGHLRDPAHGDRQEAAGAPQDLV